MDHNMHHDNVRVAVLRQLVWHLASLGRRWVGVGVPYLYIFRQATTSYTLGSKRVGRSRRSSVRKDNIVNLVS